MADFSLVAAAFEKLALVITTLITAAESKSGDLLPMGRILLTVAVTLELVTILYESFLKGDIPELIGRLFRLSIILSFPLMALANWSSAGTLIPRFFMNNVSAAVGADDPMKVVNKLFRSVEKDWRALGKNLLGGSDAAEVNTDPSAVYDPVTGLCTMNCDAKPKPSESSSYSTSVVTTIKGYILFIPMTVAFFIYIGIPMLILVLFFLATVYGVHLVIAVGVIFGPILICWLPWKPLSHLAENWIKFMMTQGLTYAVAICLATITMLGVDKLTESTQVTGIGDYIVNFIPYCLISCAMILFMAWLQSRADNIADALMNGKSESGGGFASVAQARKQLKDLKRIPKRQKP
jgi:hypothetical protein